MLEVPYSYKKSCRAVGRSTEQESNGDPFLIKFPSTWLVKKQVLGAPSEASEIQLVKVNLESYPTVSNGFCIYAGNCMGKA